MAVNDLQIKLARKYLKMKILEDDISFRGYSKQRKDVCNLFLRTVEAGESNSALIIGPRGCGKTTMIKNILWEFHKNTNFTENSILVQLNGLVHTDEKLSLIAITCQMSLENVVGDRVFGSFSENLSFLLSSLKAGQDKQCKSVIFILEEFDMFCHSHGSQTLLYNLFDIAQSKQAPICVIGVTCRLDVMELLEKRVKSRFSHRQIFIFPNESVSESNDDDSEQLFEKRLESISDLLSLPIEVKKHKSDVNSKKQNNYIDYEIPYNILRKCKTSWKEFKKLDPMFVTFWNESIKSLLDNESVRDCFLKLYNLDNTQEVFQKFLVHLISKISSDHPILEASDVSEIFQNVFNQDDRVMLLSSLSILEFSLIIAMKHQSEIFNEQPMNFEIIYSRYAKFANLNSSSHLAPRAVVLKAFEHLKSLELIAPIKETGLSTTYIQKEYQLYKLLVSSSQINEAVKMYKSMPTELVQWAASSLV